MRRILISGANRGLGLEFARQYAAAGEHVITGVRNPDEAEQLQAIAESSNGRVTIHELDVSDEASVEAFRGDVGDEPIDILIANAGVMGGDRQHRLGDLDFEAWLNTLSVNALGPVRLADAFIDNLRAGKDKKLIAITSGMGSTAESSGGYLAYRASKAALNNIWHNLALALKEEHVICVPINPGWVKTDMGGAGANLTPADSIAAMRRRIDAYTMADTGRFLSYDGKQFAW